MKSENRTDSSLLWPIILLLILFATGVVNCQTHLSSHTDNIEWQDSGGWMIASLTSRDEKLLYLQRTSKSILKAQSLEWDSDTRFDFGDAKKPYQFTGCFFIIYCKTHLVAYLVARVPCRPETPLPKL